MIFSEATLLCKTRFIMYLDDGLARSDRSPLPFWPRVVGRGADGAGVLEATLNMDRYPLSYYRITVLHEEQAG